MGGNPVHNYSHAVFVESIHKILEILGSSVTGGRCEISAALIAPGAVIGIFRYGKQFYVSVAQLFDVRYQKIRYLTVV
jgi:hypothetical protein